MISHCQQSRCQSLKESIPSVGIWPACGRFDNLRPRSFPSFFSNFWGLTVLWEYDIRFLSRAPSPRTTKKRRHPDRFMTSFIFCISSVAASISRFIRSACALKVLSEVIRIL